MQGAGARGGGKKAPAQSEFFELTSRSIPSHANGRFFGGRKGGRKPDGEERAERDFRFVFEALEIFAKTDDGSIWPEIRGWSLLSDADETER